EESVVTLDVGIIVDAEVVNIRQSPSMEGRILDTTRRGEFFLVEEKELLDEEGEAWVKIRYRGESAYVYSEYLHQMVWNTDILVNMAEVLERDVMVYAEPDSESEVLYRAYKGEPMLLYSSGDADWCKVFYSGKEAYVPADQLSVKKVSILELLE
ncbi:MAG: SH3 domain-containing protein, partial [Bacillota bacterium]|nr:SH3 domain-containing protein [Bacillota bacterium]